LTGFGAVRKIAASNESTSGAATEELIMNITIAMAVSETGAAGASRQQTARTRVKEDC
jgi:hypothetical protein